jgi:phosphoglycerate dehydrogenase-like enzyme
MTVVAWIADGPGREALGPLPGAVRLVADPAPDVEFVVPSWDDDVDLVTLPALRVVQLLSAGVDWIAGRVPPGVTLCSARGARDGAMAEWVVAALLADVKQARAVAEQQAAQRWRGVPVRDLAGLRVLVLGHGAIGRAVERLLGPFGATVTGVARRARAGVHPVEALPALLPDADAVVNLLPLTPETRGFVDAALLARMGDGALFVNAGRGATVDTDALVAELAARRLRAVLDVVEPEPLPPGHPLWTVPGCVISPHSAGDTPAAERAAWALVAEQLHRYAAGEPLRNVVTDGY